MARAIDGLIVEDLSKKSHTEEGHTYSIKKVEARVRNGNGVEYLTLRNVVLLTHYKMNMKALRKSSRMYFERPQGIERRFVENPVIKLECKGNAFAKNELVNEIKNWYGEYSRYW